LALSKDFYPPRHSLARLPTPLQFLERASSKWGCGKRLWLKRDDLTGTVLTGNKVRKLEFLVGHALLHGYDALITCGGVHSNHCRATAFVAAQMGWPCELVLRGAEPQPGGNHLLDQLAGAELTHIEPALYSRNLDSILEQRAERWRARGHKPLVIPTGGSDAIGLWGYIAACEEIKGDCEKLEIDSPVIVSATGSGGTQAGLTAGSIVHKFHAPVKGYAVCDNRDYFNNKVCADYASARSVYPQLPDINLSPDTCDDYIGSGYGLASDAVYQRIAELARLEGIVLDPVYTGKAFFGLCADLRAGVYADSSDIIFVHTGGIFGIFPHGDRLRGASQLREPSLVRGLS